MERLHGTAVGDHVDAAAIQETAVPAGITYISWAESCSRSDHTARELGGASHMVYAGSFGSRPATILFKYAAQWFRTSRILERERPKAVFVMTPPLVAALPAFWYSWRRGAQVVLDAHSAAFLHSRWRRLQGLQRAMCRYAVTTLVHNTRIAEIVHEAGGHATLVPDVPVEFPEREPLRRPEGFTVAAVCSFNCDEPIAAIFDAASQLPEVHVLMTGDARHLDPALAIRRPPNVHLTGFLSLPAYGGVLTDADAVLTLTTRDKTMLRGAFEAIYQGTPVIVSDWPILREEFTDGAVHVTNAPGSIAAGIRAIQADPQRYRAGARRLRELKLQRWNRTRAAILRHLIATPGS